MAKVKYWFNPKSLQFEIHKLTRKDKVFKFLSYVATAVVFAGVVMLISYTFFPSPQEKKLKREISQMKFEYEVLNDKMELVNNVLTDIQKRDDNIYRAIFAAEPVPKEEREAGIGGADRYANLQGYDNSELLTSTSKKLDQISRKLYVQSKSFDEVYELARKKNEMMACIPAIQPISNKDLTAIASGFGYRKHPIYKTLRMHTGIDFAADKGTPVYATGNGTVILPDNSMSGYGTFILIDHGFGYKSLYAHLSKSIVKPGQKVKRGEIIGYVGSTGVSIGPHLHYEVRFKNEPVNPVNYFFNDLSPEEYEKVLKISSQVNQSLS